MTGEAQTSKMASIFQRPAAEGAAALNGGDVVHGQPQRLIEPGAIGSVGGREESTGMASHQTK
jgi:hypothetical protein